MSSSGVRGDRQHTDRTGLEEDEDGKQEDVSLEESGSSSSASSSESEAGVKWVTWFCALKGNEFFCEIEEEYLRDNFNLTGLNLLVENYEFALDAILDENAIEIDNLAQDKQEAVEDSAITLYGLIHARYILSGPGMQRMCDKFQNCDFGRCPRIFCRGQPLLPVGLSDIPRTYSVGTFCPRCMELYYPKTARHGTLDSAYFGTTFPHLFLLTYPELIPTGDSSEKFIPRVFGFRINKESPYFTARKDVSKTLSGSLATEDSPNHETGKQEGKDAL